MFLMILNIVCAFLDPCSWLDYWGRH